MELTTKDVSRILAGLHLLEDMFAEPPTIAATSRSQWSGLKDVVTNSGKYDHPTSEELQALRKRINTQERVCPYCMQGMKFEGCEDNLYSERDNTSRWVCDNPACRAAIDVVRHAPDPYEYQAEREVFLKRTNSGKRISAFNLEDRWYILLRYYWDFPINGQRQRLDCLEFDGPAEMWEHFYQEIGTALFNDYQIESLLDNR